MLRRLAHDPTYFELWKSYGFHVTGSHFYQPIPDTRALPPSLWDRISDLPGIDIREEQQKQLLSEIVQSLRMSIQLYRTGASTQEFRYYLGNAAFEAVDAEMLFGLIRLFKPRRMYKSGPASRHSSLLMRCVATARMDIHAVSLLSNRTHLRNASLASIRR